jgi:hypothetical protein
MLQLKPNKWSCSVTAFAMALRMPVQDLIDEIGHDGSEIIFPELEDPTCRRGFHSQELIYAVWKLGFTVTPIELAPVIASDDGLNVHQVDFEFDHWKRFTGFIDTTIGVLEGRGRYCNHAVCYRYGEIYDPDGHRYDYSRKACESHGFYGNRLHVLTRNLA